MFQLQQMRNQKHIGWAIKIGFALIIVSFVFFYGWSPSHNQQQDRAFARIDTGSLNPLKRTRAITQAELQMAQGEVIQEKMMLLPPQLARQLPRSATERLAGTAEVAEQAANDILLARMADKLGIEVTSEQLVQLLREQPDLTNDMLARMAQSSGFPNVASYVDYLASRQSQTYARSLLMAGAHASLFEIWQEYQLSREKITLQLAAYPLDNYTGQVTATDAELEAYLAANAEKFKKPDQRRYAYATITREKLLEQITPTDAQVQAYYEQHQDKYMVPEAVQAEEIRVPLAADRSTTEALAILNEQREAATGADKNWADLASELTTKHPTFSFYRMETPWLSRDDDATRPELYRERAFTLADDVVSTPILTTENLYMIRIKGRRPAGVQPLADVREQVTRDYKDAEVANLMKQTTDKWLAERKTRTAMADFAQAVGVKDELTSLVATAETFLPGVGSLARDRDYLLSLELNQLSEVIQSETQISVLQVVEEVPAHDPPLAEVRSEVETAYKAERAVELARAAAEQSLALVKQGAAFETALQDAPRKPFTSDPFTRTQPVSGLGAPLIGFTTQTLTIATGSSGLSPYGTNPEEPQGFAVWRVSALDAPKLDEFRAERERFEREYLQVQRLTVMREWLADARRQAGFELVNN